MEQNDYQPYHRTVEGGLAPGFYPSKAYQDAAREANNTGRAVPFTEDDEKDFSQ